MSAPRAVSAGPALYGSERRSLSSAYALVIAAEFLWSSNAIAVKLIVREIPAFPTALIRITAVAVLLTAWNAAHRGAFPKRAEWAFFLPVGLAVAGSFLCYTLAMHKTSVGHTVFIGALVPMAVLPLVIMEGQERITRAKLAGVIVALAGVLILALEKTGGETSWKGDLVAFIGMWCFAFFTVRSRGLAAHYESGALIRYTFLAAAAFCFPFLIWQAASVPWSSLSRTAWLALLYSAIIGSASPYLAYGAALRVLTASQVAVFQYVQPVVATILGVWLLGESWGLQFVAGAVLILAGVFLAERR